MIYEHFVKLLCMCLGIVWLSGCAVKEEVAQGKPNIVILLVDDMGYGDVGVYNTNSQIPTPHIDRLAAGGMRFTNAHAPGAVCHPSRYGLLTGRYPFRTDVSVWPDEPVIAEGRMTIGSLLQDQGYHTAMVGKWHLGFGESYASDPVAAGDGQSSANTQAAYRAYNPEHPLPGGPADRGFDHFFGIRASTDIPPYFYIRDDRTVTPPTDSIDANDSRGITLSDGNRHYSSGWTSIQGAFWRAGGIAPDLELIDVLPRLTKEAINVIHNHNTNSPDEPMMLYVALPAPHTPWLPAKAHQGQSGAGMYGDFVTMVDAKIGEIIEALEQAGMAEETLVIFTSDNGPVWYEKDVRRFGHDSSGGLRGMKGDTWEAGHRMPFIVRWPGVVEAGSVTDQAVSFTDLLATFADIVSVELPEEAGEDSFSLLPLFRGEYPEHTPIRPPLVSVSARGVRAIQDGTWKLIEGLGSGGFSQPNYIKPGPKDPKGQLYNLEEDPAETNNLWFEHPEQVRHLQELLQKYEQMGRSRLLD